VCSFLFSSSGEQSQETGGRSHRQHVVEGWREILEDNERGEEQDDQKETVVVEDGEGGGLVVSDLVLLPQDSVISVLSVSILVVCQLGILVSDDSLLALLSNLVLEHKLDVLIGKAYKIGGDKCGDGKVNVVVQWLHLMNSPEDPDRNGSHDDRISVKESG